MKTKNLNKLEADDSTIISHEVHDTHFSIRFICQWYKIDVWGDFSIEDDDLIMAIQNYTSQTGQVPRPKLPNGDYGRRTKCLSW